MSHGTRMPRYAPRQFVVTGPGAEIDCLPRQLQAEGYTAREIAPRVRFPTSDGPGGVELALFSLEEGVAEGVLERLVVTLPTINPALAADLDYLVSTPPVPITGDPWGVEGSPWGVEGSPWEDSTAIGEGGLDAAKQHFRKQWALREPGIGLHDANGLRVVPAIGPFQKKVRIGILDTSPFSTPGIFPINWADPALKLEVLHPPLSDWPPPVPDNAPNISYHGLFIAGLANTVAQGAEIQLYRVLDDYGNCYSYSLYQGVAAFLVNTMAAKMSGLDGAVLNLSLGVPLAETDPPGEPPLGEITSLKEAIQAALACEVVVVAAAGNDSWALSNPRRAQQPARFADVMAVQASTVGQSRACFSNLGTIAAPGCGLLSLSYTADSTLPPIPYVYWAGTSFATPLVSGMTALAIAEGAGWNAGAAKESVYHHVHPPVPGTLPGGIARVP